MYECTACHNQFAQPKKVGLSFGFGWLFVTIISLGIGLILFIISSINRKKVCPYCGSETFLDAKYAKNNYINSQSNAQQERVIFKEEHYKTAEIPYSKTTKVFKMVLFIFVVLLIISYLKK